MRGRLHGLVVLLTFILSTSGCRPTSTPITPPTPQVIVQTRLVPGTPMQVVVTATPEPEPTAAPKPTGKITVWGWRTAMDVIRNSGVLARFRAEYPEIDVEILEFAPSDIYQKLPLALTTGAGAPDVSLLETSRLAQFVALGGLADLTDRVQPYVDQMNRYQWYDAEKDGRYYAMPWNGGPVVLYYRRDVFEKAGLPSDPDEVEEMAATWDDYLAVCKTIKEQTEAGCFSLNKADNNGRLYEIMLWQQGLGYYDEDGQVTVDSPENIATLEKLGEFWAAGVVSDQLELTDGWYAELASLDRPVATIVEASWLGVLLKTSTAAGTAGRWGVVRMPSMRAEGIRAANDGGSAFVILEQSRNKDAAWAFVEFVLGREESQLRLFTHNDLIPSLETTYDDELFIELDPFFAGQVVRYIYAQVAKEIPRAYVYGPYYSQMNGLVSRAIQKYATGEMSATEALEEAADAIRTETGLP